MCTSTSGQTLHGLTSSRWLRHLKICSRSFDAPLAGRSFGSWPTDPWRLQFSVDVQRRSSTYRNVLPGDSGWPETSFARPHPCAKFTLALWVVALVQVAPSCNPSEIAAEDKMPAPAGVGKRCARPLPESQTPCAKM